MSLLASALLAATTLAQPAPGDPIPDLISALALQSRTMVPLPAEEGPAHSELLSYSYVEFGTIWREIEEYDEDVRVWDLHASADVFDVLDGLYLLASLEKEQTKAGHSDARILGLGLGAHLALGRTLDLHGDATWLYSECDSDLSDLDGNASGWRAYGGGRWIAAEWQHGGLELHGGVSYIDLDNRISFNSSAYGWEVGARLHHLELLSLDTTYGGLANDQVVRLSVRLSF